MKEPGKTAAVSDGFVTLFLTLLTLLAAHIRVHGGDAYHYSSDEAQEVYMAAGASLREVLRFALENALHPPLGYFLRHYWLMVSTDPAFVRSLSLLFGLALIPLYYRIGIVLGGRLTGLCAAAIAAFGYGNILQSYVVRNYTLDMFLLGATFYFYLRWRTSRRVPHLIAYAGAGLLAYLDSFSALFALFTIAAYETVELYRTKAPVATLRTWLIINGILGVFAAAFYFWWRHNAPAFTALNAYLHDMLPASLWQYAPLYPPQVLNYLLLHASGMPGIFCQFVVLLLLTGIVAARSTALRFPITLSLSAFALGIVLFTIGLFPFLGSRHNLWLFPFIAAPLAVTAAHWIEILAAKLTHPQGACLLALLLLPAGWLAYDPEQRFQDTSEYTLTEQDAQNLANFIATYDASALVFVSRGDIYNLGVPDYNPYRYGGNALFGRTGNLALVPYHHTQLLYDPLRYDTNPPGKSLAGLPQVAQSMGLLDNVREFIFLLTSETAPSSAPLIRLMLCPELSKAVITFPPSETNHFFTREEILSSPATLMVVSKKDFFEQFVALSGKAHSCM